MKKLIITGAKGSGQSDFAKKLSEGMNAVTLRPTDDIEKFFERVLKEEFDFIIIEEAQAFDRCTLSVSELFSHDTLLNQRNTSVLIATYQGEPIWSTIFPTYKMEYKSIINRRYEDPFLDAVENIGRGILDGPLILLSHDTK